MAKKTVSNEFMQTFDIAEIKAKLEDIPSYEEKIEYLEKTSIGLKIRYELLQREINDILVECKSKRTDYLRKVFRDKLSCALKDAGIDVPVDKYGEVLIVYGKAQFKILSDFYYNQTIKLSVNIRGRKYNENIMSLLPDYECYGHLIIKEVAKEAYVAEFVALVKKLLDSKDVILQWNEMLR